MNRVLIVVDYQRDFVDGIIGSEAARAIEPRICQKIESYRRSGDDVIFTMDTHTPQDMDCREFSGSRRLHCEDGTEGWQIYGKVAQYLPSAKRLIRKNSYGSIELADVLRQEDYDVVELVGVTTHACVLSNAIIAAAAKPYARILVDPACTASSNQLQKQTALRILESLHIELCPQDGEGLALAAGAS
ncbi:MAG: cysteine hydrolase [Oscillospiraceae bacterium]|nr:cysteine hydrolase [Oscillospiraceae bacterium]